MRLTFALDCEIPDAKAESAGYGVVFMGRREKR